MICPFNIYNSMVYSIFTEVYNHHHKKFKNIFITSESGLIYFSYQTPYFPVSSVLSSHYFLSLQICLFWTFHKSRITQYITLSAWLLPFSMFSRFIHDVALQQFIPFYGWIHCKDLPHFVHPVISWWTFVFTLRTLWLMPLWTFYANFPVFLKQCLA